MRQRRVGLLLHESLNKVFAEDMEHETVPGFSIDAVQMTGWTPYFFLFSFLSLTTLAVDLRKAKVMWNALENDDATRRFLSRNHARIRHAATQRVQLKYSPQLEFVQTDRLKKHERVTRLVDLIEATESSTQKRD